MTKKKRYSVKLYYHTNVEVEVWADSEKDAINAAEGLVGEPHYAEQILNGLQEDSAPDVEEI